MKNAKYAVSGLLSAVLIPFSLQCSAQAASIGDCQAIQDRLARYACYDSWDAASGTVRQSAPARSNSARVQQQEEEESSLLGRIFDRDSDEAEAEQSAQVATDSSPGSDLENFGRPQANTRIVNGLDGESELIDNVADLEQLGPSLWLITLEGGQQWKQMLSKRYALQEGDQIRIYSTRWGSSFRLASNRLGGYIQVERVDSGSAVASVPQSASRQAAPAAATASAPPVQQEEEEERSFLGRIFDRDSDEAEAEEPVQVATDSTAESTVENFGRPQASARLTGGLDGKPELIDTIADLEQVGPSIWMITLESGQQWKQAVGKRYSLQVGEEVRIYPTRWGSAFRLSSSRLGGYIQVGRVD